MIFSFMSLVNNSVILINFMLRVASHLSYDLIFKLLLPTITITIIYFIWTSPIFLLERNFRGNSIRISYLCMFTFFYLVSGSHQYTVWCSRFPLSLFHFPILWRSMFIRNGLGVLVGILAWVRPCSTRW